MTSKTSKTTRPAKRRAADTTKRHPKAQEPQQPTPRMGATLREVEARADALRRAIFDVASMLRVCAAAFRDNETHEDEIADTLRVAAAKLNELPGELEMLTWTEEEIRRNRLANLEPEAQP